MCKVLNQMTELQLTCKAPFFMPECTQMHPAEEAEQHGHYVRERQAGND